MASTLTPSAILADLGNRGFTVRVTSEGGIGVSPTSMLTDTDRKVLREHRDELLAVLVPEEPWNRELASRLMHEVDGLVEQFGVSGLHPAIDAGAELMVTALASRSMKKVRFAVAEFVDAVKRVAAEQQTQVGTMESSPTGAVYPLRE